MYIHLSLSRGRGGIPLYSPLSVIVLAISADFNRTRIEHKINKKCGSGRWKKSNPCFISNVATTAFLALEGAKCCDTE